MSEFVKLSRKIYRFQLSTNATNNKQRKICTGLNVFLIIC